MAINLTTGGNNPPVPVAPAPLPTKSPVGIMNWQEKLKAGDENAQTRAVGANELTATQLNKLIASDSRYISQARDRAREEASGRGMMMSTMAAGAGQRAAIDAALPIASQDATTYGRTASENMAAVNADRLADQQMYGNLTGQEVGIRANLDEAERGRGWTSQENQLGRQFQTSERLGSQGWQTGERQAQQGWQTGERVGTQQWQGGQNELQRNYESAQNQLNREFQGTQNEKQFAQQRFLEFQNAMQNQSNLLANTIAAIYNNPNLSASEQAAAVNNARAVFQSIFNSYASTMSGGVPQIYWNPYPMTGAPTNPNPPPPVAPPPGGGGGGSGGSGGGTNTIRDPGSRGLISPK